MLLRRLRRGNLAQLLGWSVWVRGARAFFSGHWVGPLESDGPQMPGVFLIRDGQVVRRFLHVTAADRPDYVERNITFIVAPLMAAELLTAILLFLQGARDPWLLASFAPLLFNWLSTWRVQIPSTTDS